MLPFNLGGICDSCHTMLQEMKWWLVIIILYTIIINTERKYKDILYSGMIVKYTTYGRWKKSYILEVSLYVILVSLIDCVSVLCKTSIVMGLIAVLLISVNFVLKAILIFCLSNRKNNTFVIGVFILLEGISIKRKTEFNLFLFDWSMLNKSKLVNQAGYSITSVLICELLLILFFNVLNVKDIKKLTKKK